MDCDFHREWLTNKFEEIRTRLLQALSQLNDEQVNWRPNTVSLSSAVIIKHVHANMKERVAKGILQQEYIRNRDAEFEFSESSVAQLEELVQETFTQLIDTVHSISDEVFAQKQTVRDKESTNAAILHQCAAHYSEHMGQILFIAKQCLAERYEPTSV